MSLIERVLASQTIGAITLLDAIETQRDGACCVTLFLDTGVDPTTIRPPKKAKLLELCSLSDAPYLTYKVSKRGDLTFDFAGTPVDVVPAEAELELLEGSNALVALRNGKSAKTVLSRAVIKRLPKS